MTAIPQPVIAATTITRRGLFGEQPLVVGNPEQEWALWLTGLDQIVPMPSLADALIEAAEHNAVAADLDDGSPYNPVVHAVVLHKGTAWQRPKPARTQSVRAELAFSAWCSVCQEPLDEEYGYYSTVDDAVAAAEDQGWSLLPSGELVCGERDAGHFAALNPTVHRPAPGQDTLAPSLTPTPAAEAEPLPRTTTPGQFLIAARINPAPQARPAQPTPDTGAGYLSRASARTNRLTAGELREVLDQAPEYAEVQLGGYPITLAEYGHGTVDLYA